MGANELQRQPTEVSEYLSTADVAHILKCTPATARALLHSSGLPILRLGDGPYAEFRVRKDALRAWLLQQERSA